MTGSGSAFRLTFRAVVVLGTAVLVLPSAALAQSESRVSADASATLGYSNNPFTAQDNGGNGSTVATVSLSPRYQLLTQRSTLTLSADANVQQYLQDYGRNTSYSGAVDYSTRPSERVTAHVRADLSSSVLGAFNSYLPGATGTGLIDPGTGIGTEAGTSAATGGVGIVPIAPVSSPVSSLSPFTDIGLFGLRNRRRMARLSGDVGVGVTDRDSLTFAAYTEVTRYRGLQLGNYEAYNGSAGYSRRVSDYVNVGLRGSASSFNYRSSNSDSRVYSVEATGSARLSPIWTASGSLGVSFVKSDSLLSTSSTSLSGSLQVCRRGQLSTMCAQLARQVSPTGLAGSQYVTSAGLNWAWQLDEVQNLSLSGNYSKVGSSGTRLVTGGSPLQDEYVQAVAGYNRRLRERLSMIASVNYRQLLGGGNGRPADYGGQVGLSYRIGDIR